MTCRTQRISGREVEEGEMGGRRTKMWWAGASESSWQVVRGVLVVGGDVERHEALQEGLARPVVAEQSVTVHVVAGVCQGGGEARKTGGVGPGWGGAGPGIIHDHAHRKGTWLPGNLVARIQLTVSRRGTAGADTSDGGGLQAEESVEPRLHRVPRRIPDRLCQADLA